MKKIKIFTLSIMLLAACNKDMNEVNPGTNDPAVSSSNSNTARTPSTRPFEITLGSTADAGSPLTSCSGDLPGFAIGDLFLSGTATHLGQLISGQSTLHHESCNLSFATALLTTSVSGHMTASNGDRINYTGNDVINVFNLLTSSGTMGTITGEWTIIGGTGRFSGATGSITINGTVDFTTSTFAATGTGNITY